MARSPRWLFGIAGALGSMIAYLALYLATDWNPYGIWLVSWTTVTLAFYGYDKLQSLRSGLRVPKVVLHGMAAAGGFMGGWGGMLLFRHKVNQPDFWLILVLSTLGHAALVAYWFIV